MPRLIRRLITRRAVSLFRPVATARELMLHRPRSLRGTGCAMFRNSGSRSNRVSRSPVMATTAMTMSASSCPPVTSRQSCSRRNCKLIRRCAARRLFAQAFSSSIVRGNFGSLICHGRSRLHPGYEAHSASTKFRGGVQIVRLPRGIRLAANGCFGSKAATSGPPSIGQMTPAPMRDERRLGSQTSVASAKVSASSASTPRYLTVVSIFECPSRICTARRLPVCL